MLDDRLVLRTALSCAALLLAIDIVGWGFVYTVGTGLEALAVVAALGGVGLLVANVYVLLWGADRLVQRRLAAGGDGASA